MARLRRRWTAEEDTLLRRAVENATTQGRPLLWRDLAKSVPGRSNKDCRRRWWNSLADGTTKGPWCEEEDERLIEAVRKYGTNWSRVSRAIRSRNPDQCSSHWSQVLDPGINYCDWTPEEDANLLHAVLTHSTNWATIAASHVPPRTRLALKNRYSTLRLKHENESKRESTIRKSVETPPSNFEPTMAISKDVKWTPPAQIHQGRGPDPVDVLIESDEEEDDDDDDEDNEEDDGDDENRGDGNSKNSMPHIELGNSLNGVDNGAVDIQMQDTGVTASNDWADFTEPSALPPLDYFHHDAQHIPMDSWANDTESHVQYEDLLELTPGENYLCDMDDSGAMNTGVQYKSYGSTPTNIDLSNPIGFHELHRTVEIFPSTTTGMDSSSAPGSRDTPPSMHFGTSASTTPRTSISGWSHQSAHYQVCVNMICTGAQMESLMTGLASLGTCITMKIDIKEDKAPLENQL
ncbi:hypothetical protein F4805DRAFT_30213 [Annulohypoxylon moriforme]|uniref:Myb-like transcriptional regulator mfmK n=1 Tax=Annulohypoxylon moriforme TaxID=326622 RepID=MFMK_ANNMO|nr:hypothetical protein F4805DRAFT_30213 [Annulohypoxylon moriforme]